MFFQTVEAIAANDYMIKDFYSYDFPSGYESFCQINVLDGWLRVSARVVVSAN
ncbi:hypothetical protein D3C81_2216050 [compost metagenome]